MPPRRLDAYRSWLVYAGAWAFVGTLSWTTAAVLLVREVGLSPLQLVLAGTALEVAYFLAEVPTGVLADLYSRRLSLVVSALACRLGMVGVGIAQGAPAVFAAMALWGFGWTFRSGAEDAWLADEVGPERLGGAYQRGAQVERVAGLAGIGAAVALATVDLRLPLLCAGAVAAGLGLFLAVAMPERGHARQHRSSGVVGPLRSALATVAAGRREVAARPVLLAVLGIVAALGAWSEGWDRLWEAHLLLDVGLPTLFGLDDVAWFGVLAAGTLVISFAVAAPLVARIEGLGPARLARLLVVLHAVLVACALGFALADRLWVAVAAYWATTVVRSLASAPFRTWLNLGIDDSSTRATVLSIANVAGSAGEWGGGPLLGWVGTRWTVRAALAAGAALLLPAVVLLARAGRGTAGRQVGPSRRVRPGAASRD
ncbi:MFS transporter [Knoellia sp. p5-6-4]|uniref:MFS transporter n=1 Tax=unclassified Knoellia TaxID=2618719 RepID=UPI0023DBCA3A|nr:MFS transporter [Knoellia sp. p5-6-4]MDF2144208.1 MFS transporter [Knoellia sp. p5-6-4]